MASPNYDAASVQHSRNINDTVAAAATNGAVWTSAQRDNHLNAAIRRWMLLKWQQKDYVALQSYLNSETKALSSNAVALSSFTGGVSFLVSAVNTTQSPNVYVRPLPERLRGLIASGSISGIASSATNEYWVINGGSLYVYGAGATDNITLHYVKAHTAMVNGAASDWLIPDSQREVILKLALQEAMTESPDQFNVTRIQAVTPAIQTETAVSADAR